jgi:hypothetical protein
MSSCKPPLDTLTSVLKSGLPNSELFLDPLVFNKLLLLRMLLLKTLEHEAAVKCILRCMKGTSSFYFYLTRGSLLPLHCFTGVDWTGSINN